MKIELISMWYNEEVFAEYFLNHYAWVDKIHILLDADTNDLSEAIARLYSNVEIEYVYFPDRLNDGLKSHEIISKYDSISDADYVILVDADEFIFCNQLNKPVKLHIEETLKDIYFVNLWQIYKHETDLPLDPSIPIHIQRRHGDPNMENAKNIIYVKPIVIRSGKDLLLGTGNHSVIYRGVNVVWHNGDRNAMKELNVSIERHEMLQGSHWRLVDIDETIRRRILNRKPRISKFNLDNGLGINYIDMTEDDILREYNENKNNPIVIMDMDDIK